MTRLRIIFLDVETRLWAEDLNPDKIAGWDALRRGEGGASAICIYDLHERWAYTYDDHTIKAAAAHIESADLVVGFSLRDFDIPVIEGILGRKLRIKAMYDIYTESIKAAAARGIVGRKGDFKLETLCKRNIGRGKIDNGGNVKNLISRGQWAKVFNYCLDDVHLTFDLFAKLCRDGGLHILDGKYINLDPIPAVYVAAMAQETQ